MSTAAPHSDGMDEVLGRLRAGETAPVDALQELRHARKEGRITDGRRYRAALSEVYDHLPIWLEGPRPAKVSDSARSSGN